MDSLREIAFFALPPILGAVIGWFTNFLAVKLLFRPRRPWRFLFFKLHGLIPKRHHEIAETVGEIVERELISHRDIRQIVDTQEFKQRVLGFLEDKLDEFLRQKLVSLNPLITSLISTQLVTSVRQAMLNEFIRHLPDLMDQVFDAAEHEIDLRQTVIDKIEAFEMEKLEGVIQEVAKREFRTIELLGGVLGFMIGAVQAGALALLRVL